MASKSRGGRRAHNPEARGSTPRLATRPGPCVTLEEPYRTMARMDLRRQPLENDGYLRYLLSVYSGLSIESFL